MNFKSLSRRITTALGYRDNMDPFVRDIFPLLILYRVMARCPFRTNEHGQLEVKLFTSNGLYFVFTYGFIIFLVVDAYREDDVMNYFKDENFSSTIVGISGVLIGILHFSVSLGLCNLWVPAMNYFAEWEKLNANFEKLMGARKQTCMQLSSLLSAFCIPIGSFATMLPLTSIFFGRYWYHTCVAPIVFISTTTEMWVFMFACGEMINMSSQINSRLKSLLKNERTTAQELYAIRRLWLELARLVRKTGSCISLTLFLELGSTTTFFSFSAFGGISCLITGKEETLQYLVVFCVAALRLILFFETGEQTAQHVGKNIVEILSTAEVLNMDYSTIEEVDIFIQSIKSNYPTINLGGLTRVSRRELLSLMMEALFYILILVQMRVSPKRKRTAEAYLTANQE